MRSRTVALVLGLVLLTAACGARLTEEQRAAALAAGGGGAAVDPETGEVIEPGAGPASPGATTGPGAGPGNGGAPGPAAADCGEGEPGASDTGVTATEIKLAAVIDLSGPQTGLFKAAAQGIQAWQAYVNNAGGICGRNVAVDVLDTGTSSGGNQAATKQACNNSFAIVGSMSAFDGGGYDSGNACGIPAIPAVATNVWKPEEVFPPNYFPTYPNRGDKLIDTASYVNETHSNVKSNAGVMWLNQDVARNNAWARAAGYEQAGFGKPEWQYTQEAQVADPNYASYVSRMKSADIKYLTFVGNYQSVENLLQAMDQQSWHPEFMDFDSVVYSPVFLKDLQDRGITTTNLFWFVNTALFEEASGNQEMQLYQQWLEQVAPGADPDYFGLYAWSAGRLFQQVAEGVGVELTRKALIAELGNTKEWDGHGLHAAHQISAKTASPCYLYGKIENYEFVRVSPASGWICNHPLRNVQYPPPDPR